MRPDAAGDASHTPQGEVTVVYRNYKGETTCRRILPYRIWFGPTEWHPEPQWVMEALDLDKDVLRTFAMRDILDFDPSRTASSLT